MPAHQTSEAAPSAMAEYHRAVGKITVGWAFYETHVNRFIWELADVEQYVGACITAQIANPSSRFRALIALVKHRGGSPDQVKKLEKIRQNAESLARQRNRYVHDPAAFDSEGNFVRIEITADRELLFGPQPADRKDMDQLAAKIKAACREFWDLAVQIRSTIAPFSDGRFADSPGIGLRSRFKSLCIDAISCEASCDHSD